MKGGLHNKSPTMGSTTHVTFRNIMKKY